MELDISSSADLRERFRQTQRDSPQRAAVLRAALTGPEGEALVEQLVSEYSIGMQMGEPNAVQDALTNVEIINQALALEGVAAVMSEQIHAFCTSFLRQVAPSNHRVVSDIADALEVLAVECRAATQTVEQAQIRQADQSLAGQLQDASAHLRALATYADEGRKALRESLDHLTSRADLVHWLLMYAVGLHGHSEETLEATSRIRLPVGVRNNAIPIGTITVGILDHVADLKHGAPGNPGDLDVAALRDRLTGQIDGISADLLTPLAPELLTHILHFADPADVERLGITSKQLRSVVGAYQEQDEGAVKHDHLVSLAMGQRRRVRRKQLKESADRYEQWFRERPRQSSSLLKEYADAVVKLREAIESLRSQTTSASLIRYKLPIWRRAAATAPVPGREWQHILEAARRLEEFNYRLAGLVALQGSGVRILPAFVIPLPDQLNAERELLLDGTAEDIRHELQTTVRGLLDEMEQQLDAWGASLVRWKTEIARYIDAVRRRAAAVVAIIDKLARERDEHVGKT